MREGVGRQVLVLAVPDVSFREARRAQIDQGLVGDRPEMQTPPRAARPLLQVMDLRLPTLRIVLPEIAIGPGRRFVHPTGRRTDVLAIEPRRWHCALSGNKVRFPRECLTGRTTEPGAKPQRTPITDGIFQPGSS